MRRAHLTTLAAAGVALAAIGIALLMADIRPAHAQDEAPEPAEYVGADECASCHRSLARDHEDTMHAFALRDTGRRKNDILADFDTGEDVRTVLIPGEDEARPFDEDDIAYAVGGGRYAQQYLYEADRDELIVLPAQWNVATETWEPLVLGDAWPSEQYDWELNCAYCHTTGFDIERDRWEDDAVQCEACHGPGSIHAELADDAGRTPNDEELVVLRGAIVNGADPQMCGQCHGQGVGPDGRPYPAGYRPGTDLHSIYELVASDSPAHWWSTGHARQKYMQYNEWQNSSHATSLDDLRGSEETADQCLTCHSEDARRTLRLIDAVEEGERDGQPLDPLTVESAQWGVTCTTCHNPHSDSGEPFNLVEEANALCASCHTDSPDSPGLHYPVVEMFEGIGLIDGIDGVPGAHFSAEDGPRCTTCHMQSVPVDMATRETHTFKPVLPGHEDGELPNTCAGCHEDLTTADLQLLVDNTQSAVKTRVENAKAVMAAIAPGDEAEVAAAALEFVENEGSFGIHNYAYTDALLTAAEQALGLTADRDASATPTETPGPTPLPPVIEAPQQPVEPVVASGVRPVTILVIGGVVALLLVSAALFFRSPGAREGR